jgi:catechol 2,3-dioxygenase-like lactoylglutathione lyase family enzyme
MTQPVRSVVAMLFVQSVPASIEFYGKLGFEVGNTFTPDGAPQPAWAYLQSDTGQLMVSAASHPVNAAEQAICLWLYVDDVAAKHAELAAAGIKVSGITFPFYNPRGEFRLKDPDGYDLFIAHT